ncbi:MAG TPA: OpgC domain-containing protein [Bradyrhizobium sp.]|nr:OpgC domain-containing protein [Bradyrhizobium sp.]
MLVLADLPPAGRDVRLDLFRGLANWAIFLDHIPHEVLSWGTTRNYGFSDAADLFVFISGYTAAFVFGRIMIERGYLAAASRLLKRALELYAAHIIVVVVYIAVIASVSRGLHDPNDLDVFNVAPFISKPVWEFIQVLALRYRPVNLDVLPLYILLLATFAPALWLMVRKPTLTLIGAMLAYFAARHFGWNLPSSRVALWYFNPFTWQLLFFLGAWIAVGGAEPLQSIVRTRTVFWLAIAYLVFAFVVTTAIHSPFLANLLPPWVLEPFDPNDKTNLAPYRILHLLALAVVVTRFLRADSPILRWHSLTPLIKCGQNSLQVFCIGIVLSFCAHAAIEQSLNSLWVQISAGAAGVMLMTTGAYYWTWCKQRLFGQCGPA